MYFIVVLFCFFALVYTHVTSAADSVTESTVQSTSETSILKNLRLRSFNEVMSPGLNNCGSSVPHHGGGPFVPSFLSGILWTDYEIGSNYKLLYFQKYTLDFDGATTPSGVGGRFLDPRFGIRKTKVFNHPDLSMDADLFVQPGITGALMPQQGRDFDLGFRGNTQYTIPSSRWSVGAITELIFTVYREDSKSSDLSGLIVPWASYQISPRFSTQHWVVAPYKHHKGDMFSEFAWDITGMPYTQNGIGVSVTPTLWVAGMMNNYLLSTPKLQNTWASLWVSLNFL